jgi:N-acetylmuramoyl-L-alanine amidase
MYRARLVLVIAFMLSGGTSFAAKRRVFIDPGHGYPGNEGATTMLCEKEEEVVLEIARELASYLSDRGGFEVALARTSSVGPTYDRRLEAAAKFRADVLISIHLDARGEAALDGGCPRNDAQPGFGVLFSDRGSKRLVKKRRTLSRSLADALSARGFLAYDGFDYGSLYELDPTPGVFIDRRGLFMLRRPAMPSVIIETHHGLSAEERRKWRDPETRTAFAEAVRVGLDDLFLGRKKDGG